MSVVAVRYARALADAIFDQKLDALKTAAALHELKELLDSSHELRVVWENPSVSHEQKHGVLDAIVQKTKLPKLLRNFMAGLSDCLCRGRILEGGGCCLGGDSAHGRRGRA